MDENYATTLRDLEDENRRALAEAFLTGRAARKEIKLNELDNEERKLYDKAMEKEWLSWMHFDAVEKLTEEQKLAFYKSGTKSVGTRWVFTDKNDLLRATQPGLGISAKARLVVQGCQERTDTIRSDSPAASLEAFHVLCSIASSFGWKITKADASNAYLQAGGIERVLILRPPAPLPPGVDQLDLLRAKGSIYGTRDAGRAFWLYLRAILVAAGWRESRLEAALFWYVEGGVTKGALITHVDDLLYAVDPASAKAKESLDTIAGQINLTMSEVPFVYCGKRLDQTDDGSIHVSMQDAIKALSAVHISKARRAEPGASLDPEEISELRSGFGSFGWIARQLRADVAVDVSLGQQATADPRVRHLTAMNRCIEQVKKDVDFCLAFHHGHVDWHTCGVWAVADASHGNVDAPELGQLGENVKSQCGYILGLSNDELLAGRADYVHVLEWASSSVKRVARGTLSAEAYGVVDGAESADWLRCTVTEFRRPEEHIRDLESDTLRPAVAWFTDNKSLDDMLLRDCGKPSDKRVRIVTAQLRQMLLDDYTNIYWIDTLVNIADPMTKEGLDPTLLKSAMRDGWYSPEATSEAIQQKLEQRAGRARRKDEKRNQVEAKRPS